MQQNFKQIGIYKKQNLALITWSLTKLTIEKKKSDSHWPWQSLTTKRTEESLI
jgi:hypothetical protein